MKAVKGDSLAHHGVGDTAMPSVGNAIEAFGLHHPACGMAPECQHCSHVLRERIKTTNTQRLHLSRILHHKPGRPQDKGYW